MDDRKVFAASESKLTTVLRATSNAMLDIGLHWNPKKCGVIHLRKGKQIENAADLKLDEYTLVKSLKTGSSYTFLQDEKLALAVAAKVYLQRLSVIWTSPLSDANRAKATNQFALPVLTYLMWTQHWPLTELREIDRETRKVVSENGGRHPLSSTALFYLPRVAGGRGMKAIEQEYKLSKIKAAIKFYNNLDPMMNTVRELEEEAEKKGFSSLVKHANKFAEELGTTLTLEPAESSCSSQSNPEKKITGYHVKLQLKKDVCAGLENKVQDQKWQGRLVSSRWNDGQLSKRGCFAWLSEWSCAPTHTVAGVMELYEQLLPTRVYSAYKTGTSDQNNIMCRMCGKAPECLAHVLAGCPSLSQSKYMERHNAALKVLFFEILRDLDLNETVSPWPSRIEPKPLYESTQAQAFGDVPVYAEHTTVRANRVDARIIDHKEKKALLVEMSCPWIDNREKKEAEKMEKKGPLRFELIKRYQNYKIVQLNVIMDVLGG